MWNLNIRPKIKQFLLYYKIWLYIGVKQIHNEYVVTEFVTEIETLDINAAKNGHLQTKGKSLTLETFTLACTFQVAYV